MKDPQYKSKSSQTGAGIIGKKQRVWDIRERIEEKKTDDEGFARKIQEAARGMGPGL